MTPRELEKQALVNYLQNGGNAQSTLPNNGSDGGRQQMANYLLNSYVQSIPYQGIMPGSPSRFDTVASSPYYDEGSIQNEPSMAETAAHYAKPVGEIASEVTGVPSFNRGIDASAQGYVNENPYQMVGGAAQAGLSALPYAGPAARAAFATAPAAMATGAAYGAAPVFASGLIGGSNKAQAQDKGSGLDMLYERSRSLDASIKEARAAAEAEAATGRGPKYDAAMQRLQDLEAQQQQLGDRIMAQEERNTPEAIAARERAEAEAKAKTGFRERFPEATALLPAVGIGLAAGLPFAGKALGNFSSWLPHSSAGRMSKAINRTERAIKDKDVMQASLGSKILDEQVASEAAKPKPKIIDDALKTLAAGASGGMLTAEANMFPDQYDAAMLPQGSPEQEAAQGRALDIWRYLKTGAAGTLTGMSGYKGAGLLTDPFRRKPDVNRAKGVSAVAKKEFPDQVGGVRNSLSSADAKGKPASGSGKGGRRQKRPNMLSRASRGNIAEEFKKSDGKISLERAQQFAPGVSKKKVNEYLMNLKAARSDSM